MNTSTKLILGTLAAVVLTSPVMADTLRHAHGRAATSTTIVTTDEGQRSAGPVRQGHFNTPDSEDCTHVAFPQCSGGQ
jgi:hypothetical protein